ncbi:hypothetical protein [Nocardiopsis alkaliphila]|uniref:hypothetical protein n=1 Tax=Nocardiopsis alkaliphila TaxID=225762 RepID=UPI0004776D0B|nr:hypothetical protein [Nocardiopsis alkaliphila]
MSWTDYSQNVRIRDLEENLSSAHSQMARERSRMRSELGRLRGNLEQRLDRVSATLDAFIELSDLRVTLGMFDGAAIARHRTLQLLDGAALGTLELDDVPGYWLVPAARGLHSLLNGDLSRARLRFDEATRIDAARARTFVALAAALTSAENARTLGEDVAADLLPHLPSPDAGLTRGQRALWLLSADGSFGDHARERLLLSTLRHWSTEGFQAPTVDAWTAPASGGTRPGPKDDPTIAQRAEAARRMRELRERITTITTLGGEETPTEVLAPDPDSAAFLQQTLRLLVEEGSPEEAPLLAEASRLRAVIEGSGQEVTLPSWDETVEKVDTLLQRDLTTEQSPPHRRTFALVLQRSAVLEGAQALVTRACAPPPEKTDLATRGVTIPITAAGADQGRLEEARRRIEAHTTPNGNARTMLWAAVATAGVLLMISLLTTHGVLWLLTVLSAGGAAMAYRTSTREQGEAERAREREGRMLRERVDKAVEDRRRALAEAEEHAASAREDLREVQRMLNP